MNLSFLAPLFLAGLAALAVPVWVHLIQRDRGRVVRFPSLMFIQRVPYKSVRRQKIRHWLLLLLRALALALVVAAFARPLLEGAPGVAVSFQGSREVVILLDRSYSMGYGDHWDRARAAARDVLRGLDRDDRATLVYFTTAAEAVRQPTTDHARLVASLDTARVSSGGTSYGPALELAESILESSDLPLKEAVLISDFQRIGWGGEASARVPPGAQLTTVSVAEPGTGNVAVTGVQLRRGTFAGEERVTTTARLVNRSPDPVDALEVSLEVDGMEVGTGTVRLGPNSSATVTFTPFTLTDRHTRGVVRARPDPLPADNEFRFVLSPEDAIGVLILNGPGAAPSSLYVRRALEIGEDPPFAVEAKGLAQFQPSDLEGRRLVVLNDAPVTSGAMTGRFREFVEEGGGLLIVAGDRTRWPADDADLLPGVPGEPVGRTARRGATLGYLNYSHPALELFSAPRSGDFTAARFYRYRPVQVEGSEGVLARFDDGTVALAERRSGDGAAMVWASTLDAFWNDLALQPVFLPLMHQLAKHLASFERSGAWVTVGEVLPLDVRSLTGMLAAEGGGEEVPFVVSPSGQRAPLEVGSLAPYLEVREQGFYEIRAPGAGRAFAAAANLDVRESDLAAMDPVELVTAVTGSDEPETPVASAAGVVTPQDRERRQAMWWYLLAAAFLLLATETVVSNRLSRFQR